MRFKLPDCFFEADVTYEGCLRLFTDEGEEIMIGFFGGKRFEILEEAMEQCRKLNQRSNK
ncbi:hypothetical protein LCGC14_0970200 [marine sediment metagenome]|uniref:Uncharacterized protein n=1 Tax=marine sediment metagenome TaxID=412755 RepID=A0A0F9NY21_9ZZZZ